MVLERHIRFRSYPSLWGRRFLTSYRGDEGGRRYRALVSIDGMVGGLHIFYAVCGEK